tara:strand:+ start:652 stop:906 length:255 start_codon:yes stop_codon:yes gene_type:complete
MPRTKIIDGVETQLTAEEEKARDAEEAQSELDRQEYAKVKYKDDRKMAYPEIGDQLDDLFKQGVFSKEMSDKLQKVKSDHPKPE